MTKGFRLFNLFLIIFSCVLLTSVVILYILRRFVSVKELLTLQVFSMPFFIYLFLTLTFLSVIVSVMLYYGMKLSQRQIVQKLQWLIVGNYEHPIFQKSVNTTPLLSGYTDVVDEQLNTLSERLIEINDLLKQTSKETRPLNLEEKAKLLEEERHRIARELHDSVSQQLFATMMMLSALNYSLSDKQSSLHTQLKTIEDSIHAAQTEMRALLLHLRPISLEGKTLKQGIERLLMEVQSKVKLNVLSQIENVSLVSTIEDNLFRVLQELISNTLRHAKASHLELYLTQDNQYVKLRLVDNGIGFDTTQSSMGYGLLNIKERVSAMGGTLNIVSVPNQGTIVDIKIIK
ncbi:MULTISPECIES: sensor histidine kinase [unclassified Granulicatella]|uniref:sensor histidine kinase n=1 Tax=unclassified Granulicatella TaxID=2630493 RepID=UPI0010748736|nr:MULTISPECIES: sensor histidine kinase [unclassified Granulicatella]MBF0780731.1 sensor histidine kinase [Granulicatella sp. 19428wC4_WM01]TFU94190.1 sensor histidine kinase [Granulicatella sp. WM01]